MRDILNLKKTQRVRFWKKKFTKCQILRAIALQFAKFSCVHQKSVFFGENSKYGVGLWNQVILLG